jgi:hypothetical protein
MNKNITGHDIDKSKEKKDKKAHECVYAFNPKQNTPLVP